MNTKKLIAAVAAGALALGCTIGGTLAWLLDSTDTITNTFTYGDINISLDETTGESYEFLPGTEIAKNPTVTVEAGSEACWLFVEVEEEDWPDTDKISYALASDWTKLQDGVYYCTVDETTATAGTTIGVLAGDKITVSGTLTKSEIEKFADEATLSFTAYAVQAGAAETAAAAWAIAIDPTQY